MQESPVQFLGWDVPLEKGLGYLITQCCILGFSGDSDGNESSTMWETLVQFLGWEDPLEEGMRTHSSILAWRVPTDRGAWWATVHRIAKSQT